MANFRLELLADDPVEKPYSCGTVVRQGYEFGEKYRQRHSGRKDERLDLILRDLSDGRFWGVLYLIDGCNNRSNPDSPEKMSEARAWAAQNFDNFELQQMLNICVNYALLVPCKTGWPGTYKGHSILHRELVEKPDSMFAGVVDESFRKRLNNCRFWEELKDLSPGVNNGVSYVVINDVLEHNFSDLSVDFAPKGLEILARRENHSSFDLRFLTDKAVDKYAEFLGMLYNGLYEKDFVYLFLPYLFESIRVFGMFDENEGEPRFKEDNPKTASFKARLTGPIMCGYIAANETVRNALSKELANYLVFGHYERHVADVVSCVAEPHEMLARIASTCDSTKSIGRIMKQIAKSAGNQ